MATFIDEYDMVIKINPAELVLKGKNRKYFFNKLLSRIKRSLGIDHKQIKRQGISLFVEYNKEYIDKLKKIPGIENIFVFKKVLVENEVRELLLNTIKDDEIFTIRSKRIDKGYPMTSSDFNYFVANYLAEHGKLNGDRKSKNKYIIEIHEDYFLVATEKHKTMGGLPISENNGLLLLSGGIDSPVAAYMANKRGIKLSFLHFSGLHYEANGRDKMYSLMETLSQYNGKSIILIAPLTNVLDVLFKPEFEDYRIVLLRRIMLKTAEKLTQKGYGDIIVTGDNIGQVASQTFQNLYIQNKSVDSLIVRPLICFNKNEIMDIARKIGTYNASIIPYDDCCTVFVPKNPKTKGKIKAVEELEKKLNIDELVNNIIDNLETKIFDPFKKN